jgi:hypothetical protein
VYWGCDYTTALNIEVDPQRRRFCRRESDFYLLFFASQSLHKKKIFSGEVKDSVIFLFFF